MKCQKQAQGSMHYNIQLKQGIHLIWEKRESLISNKKEKYHDNIKTLYVNIFNFMCESKFFACESTKMC